MEDVINKLIEREWEWMTIKNRKLICKCGLRHKNILAKNLVISNEAVELNKFYKAVQREQFHE